MEPKRMKFEDEEPMKTGEIEDKLAPNISLDQRVDTCSVLGEIKETNFPSDFTYTSKKVKNFKGFPEAKTRNKLISPKQEGNKKSSIFCLENGLNSLRVENKMHHGVGDSSQMINPSDNEDIPRILIEVQQENNRKLQSMTEAEIINEKKELLATIDPKLLNYFLKRAEDKKKLNPTLGSQLETNETVDLSSEDSEMNEVKNEYPRSCSDYPININEAKKFVHMDNLEPEKLEWMTNIPPPKPIHASSGDVARFDFDGNIVDKHSKIPMDRGLHHHGDEPHRPGYTVEELFIFVRSSFPQQRVVGLQIIANIVKKSKEGLYDDILSEPILPCLLDAGILFLLRYSLDDSTHHVVWALQALRNLLVSHPDEICLDRVLCWPMGPVQPSLPTEITSVPLKMKEFNEQKAELKDVQLMKLDVITALVRMDVIHRISYILEVLRPPPVAVIAALEILSRICLHNLESVWIVLNNEPLLKLITEEFMCPNWSLLGNPHQVTSVYGTPLRQAFKLFRIISSWSRQIALRLLDILPKLGQIIMCHVALDPSDIGIPVGEALNVILETYYLWQIFLTYGLLTQEFIYMFPVIMKSLQYYCTNLSINNYQDHDKCHFSVVTALLNVIHSVFNILGSKSNSCCKIEWSHVSGLFPLIETCFIKWMTELSRTGSVEQLNGPLLNVLGSICSVVNNYYAVSTSQAGFDSISRIESVEQIFAQSLTPLFLQSSIISSLLGSLKAFSAVLDHHKSGTLRDPSNLPSLGSMSWAGDVSPNLFEFSPFPFLVPLMRLLYNFTHLHKELNNQVYVNLLTYQPLLEYLRKVAEERCVNVNNYFLKYELYFLYWLLKIADLKENAVTSKCFHGVAIQLMRLFQVGDEWYMKDTLETLVFSATIFKKPADLDQKMEQLKINSETNETNDSNEKWQIIDKAWKRLSSIRACYLTVVYPYSKSIEQSRRRVFSDVDAVDSLTIKAKVGSCLPEDWMFIPLIQRFDKLDKQENRTEISTPYDISTVSNCLQFVYLLISSTSVDYISTTSKFCRIACVFLVANDMFLDKEINYLLDGLLNQILKEKRYEELDFEAEIPGIASFSDFYNSLVDQFCAVSYGDRLFSTFVMIPAASRFPTHLRRLLWTEQSVCLRLLGTPFEKFPVPMTFMVNPPDSNPSMIEIYFESIIRGTLKQQWSPILFCVAVTHIKSFLNSNPEHPLSESISKCLHLPKNEIIKNHFY